MRFALGMLSLIGCIPFSISLAIADPPGTPAAAPTATPAAAAAAPEKASTASNPSSAEQAPAAPAAAAPAAAATPTAAPPADDAQVEKHFRAMGYSVYMIKGEKNFCRREPVIGSHLAGPLTCMTAAEAQSIESDSRKNVEHMQRSMGCMNFGRTANCGN